MKNIISDSKYALIFLHNWEDESTYICFYNVVIMQKGHQEHLSNFITLRDVPRTTETSLTIA